MNVVIFGATGMVVNVGRAMIAAVQYGYERPIIESADIEQLAGERQQ